mmetsp:Transcript_52072/g.121065  ORF Transcript_52072/g.121065 Transcript_52072/m.121065 type:complete len:210 (-) Transcript_52072:658-1287(-)
MVCHVVAYASCHLRAAATGVLVKQIELVDCDHVEQSQTPAQVLVLAEGVLCIVADEAIVLLVPVHRLPSHSIFLDLLTSVHVAEVDAQRCACQHLNGPMHAPLTVVEVLGAGLGHTADHALQPMRQEDGVSIKLHCPVMALPAAHLCYLPPEHHKDICVQSRAPAPTMRNLQADAYGHSHQRRSPVGAVRPEQKGHIAEDRVFVAEEQA